MKSIPVAMTWELLRRGLAILPTAALCANLLPLLLLSALRLDGGLDPSDPSMLAIFFTVTPINTFLFSVALFQALGPLARFYPLPVSTRSLVAWQLLLAMALTAIESMTSTLVLNRMFELNWPCFGPALLASIGAASVLTALWSAEKSGWLPVAVCAAAAVPGCWFKSRFGPMFSQPQHQWSAVTPVEFLSLLLFAGMIYGIAVKGVARRRCGELLPSLGIVEWFERVLDPPADETFSNSTAEQAQYWMLWRQKGWAIPIIVLFGMLIGLSIWGLFVRELQPLLEGYVAGGAMLTLAGCCGLFLGNLGSDDVTYGMGHFLATRPLTSTKIAEITLRVLGKSVLLAWSVWAVPFLILLAWSASGQTDTITRVDLLFHWGWRFLPVTLLSCWMTTSVLASLAMTGRTNLAPYLIFSALVIVIGYIMVVKYAVTVPTRDTLNHGFGISMGILMLAGTVGTYRFAIRGRLIRQSTAIAAFTVWMLLCVLILADTWFHPDRPVVVAVLALGLAAIVVLPLSAAPLAVASNRTR